MASTGFERWSNNDLRNLNIKGVRFGYKKPILDVELNELQDLIYTSSLNNNRVNNKPNTYTSSAGSKLFWEYSKSGNTTLASLKLTSTTDNDVIKLVFSGGVEYYFLPQAAGTVTLMTIALPTNATDGTVWTATLKGHLTTVSPSSSDTGEYDSEVAYAIDSRTPTLVSTKRIMLKTGFSEFDDEGNPYYEINKESYETAYNRMMNTKVDGLNDREEVEFILGSWKADSSSDIGWSYAYEVQKEIMGVNESKYELLSDGIEVYGTYSVTPLVAAGGAGTCEVRLDFPVKSIRYGYFCLMVDGEIVSEATPINHPLRTSDTIINNERTTIAMFDLRDIVVDDKMWGNYTGQSWEDLLNQKWFEVNEYSEPSLQMSFNEVSKLGDVSFGSLIIKR